MKSMNNSVNLIGNLGQDVALLTFKSGNKKANVSLATTNYYKTSTGETQKETQWHNIVAWGLQAELMSKALKKGNMVAIKGSIQYRGYENKEGKEVKTTEVVVDEFIIMGGKNQAKSETPKPSKKSNTPEEAPLPF
jgi:single-strand DNA-binding protein